MAVNFACYFIFFFIAFSGLPIRNSLKRDESRHKQGRRIYNSKKIKIKKNSKKKEKDICGFKKKKKNETGGQKIRDHPVCFSGELDQLTNILSNQVPQEECGDRFSEEKK